MARCEIIRESNCRKKKPVQVLTQFNTFWLVVKCIKP